jgi:DNA-binding SARP family transcriptional activator
LTQPRTGTEVTRVQVCGRLVIEAGGRRVEDRLPGRLGRLLFVYLVLNRTRDVLKDAIVDAVWAEPSPRGADLTLRTLLSKVRSAYGIEIQARAGGYRLNLPADAQVDIEAALDAIHRAETAVAGNDWRRAWAPAQIALFTARRGFLEGEDAAWIETQRRTLAEVELRALECYAAACLGIGGIELAAAERAARGLVEREPFRESGYRILMRVLAERGNLANALLIYEQLSERLGSELGVDPSPQTKVLHRELLRLA